jgi:transcriptional regulator
MTNDSLEQRLRTTLGASYSLHSFAGGSTMYIPRTNAEGRAEVLTAFVCAHPLATLVSAGPNGELWATHLPVVYDPKRGPHGTIEGHVARANPHHHLVRATAAYAPEQAVRESLMIFTGPDAYITPAWYPRTTEDGEVVPTWNYIAIHAYGTLRLREDPEWLLAHVSRLTKQSEASRSDRWAVSDAPSEYIAQELRAIVGFEMEVTRLDARWKMSQNRTPEEIDGVIDGLRASECPMDREVAGIVEERRPNKG